MSDAKDEKIEFVWEKPELLTFCPSHRYHGASCALPTAAAGGDTCGAPGFDDEV